MGLVYHNIRELNYDNMLVALYSFDEANKLSISLSNEVFVKKF